MEGDLMNFYDVYLGEDLVVSDVAEIDLKHKLDFIKCYFIEYPKDDLKDREVRVVSMKTTKINPPNYGFIDVTLDDSHIDYLYSLIEKYEPEGSPQQYATHR